MTLPSYFVWLTWRLFLKFSLRKLFLSVGGLEVLRLYLYIAQMTAADLVPLIPFHYSFFESNHLTHTGSHQHPNEHSDGQKRKLWEIVHIFSSVLLASVLTSYKFFLLFVMFLHLIISSKLWNPCAFVEPWPCSKSVIIFLAGAELSFVISCSLFLLLFLKK